MVGELIAHANSAMVRIARLARERDAPPAVRLEAERARWVIVRELTELLQKLGQLPNVGPEVHAELFHRIDSENPFCSIHAEVQRVIGLQQQVLLNSPDTLGEQLKPLNDLIVALSRPPIPSPGTLEPVSESNNDASEEAP